MPIDGRLSRRRSTRAPVHWRLPSPPPERATPAAARQPFSRRVFDETITIHNNHAQRLLDRGFLLAVRALYGIDVVLRIIGEDRELDQVEEILGRRIGELAAELRAEHARLTQLREANGISATPATPTPDASRFRSPRPSSPSTRR